MPDKSDDPKIYIIFYLRASLEFGPAGIEEMNGYPDWLRVEKKRLHVNEAAV